METYKVNSCVYGRDVFNSTIGKQLVHKREVSNSRMWLELLQNNFSSLFSGVPSVQVRTRLSSDLS